jgi:hypothetical protein
MINTWILLEMQALEGRLPDPYVAETSITCLSSFRPVCTLRQAKQVCVFLCSTVSRIVASLFRTVTN